MENDGEDSVAVGAVEARRALVLGPLVQAYIKGTDSLESGLNDAVWERGVSRATVWRWKKSGWSKKVDAPVPWLLGNGAAQSVRP